MSAAIHPMLRVIQDLFILINVHQYILHTFVTGMENLIESEQVRWTEFKLKG